MSATAAVLSAGALGGALGTWLVRGLARRAGFVAKPNPIVPQHRAPTAYLGGVGIAVGIATTMLLVPDTCGRAFVLPAAGYLALGLWDDLRPLRPLSKLIFQLALAGLAAWLARGGGPSGIGALDAALRVAWIVLLVNAVNVTDVCDGLAGGIAAIGFTFLGAWNPGMRPLAWGLAAACAGFLVFNRPPASIFMGDAGSHLLGYALAWTSFPLLGRWPDGLMAVAAVAPFLFEVTFLIVVRTRRGMAWWRGSPDHFALRMQAAGLSRRRTVALSWTAAAVVGVLASWLPSASPVSHAVFGAGLAAAAGAFAAWLLRHDVHVGSLAGRAAEPS